MPLAVRAVLGSLESTDGEVVAVTLSPYPEGRTVRPTDDKESVPG